MEELFHARSLRLPKSMKRLEKAGFKAKKGTFKLFKKSDGKTRRKKKGGGILRQDPWAAKKGGNSTRPVLLGGTYRTDPGTADGGHGHGMGVGGGSAKKGGKISYQ